MTFKYVVGPFHSVSHSKIPNSICCFEKWWPNRQYFVVMFLYQFCKVACFPVILHKQVF